MTEEGSSWGHSWGPANTQTHTHTHTHKHTHSNVNVYMCELWHTHTRDYFFFQSPRSGFQEEEGSEVNIKSICLCICTQSVETISLSYPTLAIKPYQYHLLDYGCVWESNVFSPHHPRLHLCQDMSDQSSWREGRQKLTSPSSWAFTSKALHVITLEWNHSSPLITSDKISTLFSSAVPISPLLSLHSHSQTQELVSWAALALPPG